jgi:3-oxoacyl-[acyl-carrier-protein] synthase-3
MIQSKFENVKIVAMATAVPKNKDFLSETYNSIFGEELVAKFSKTVGVVERRLAAEEQASSDFAYVAAERVLTDKIINRNEIGICIFVTQTPDYRIPSTSCVLHKRLGLSKDCIVFDINLGCSGYVYGLQVVCSLMQSVSCRYALLLVGDTITKSVAPADSASSMLFGDGGSATLLEKTDKVSPIFAGYRTDGEGFKAIIIPSGAYRNRFVSVERVRWADGNERSDYDLYMNGVDVFSFTITEIPLMIKQFMENNNLDLEQFDCYAFHQANGFILKQIIKKAKMKKEKMLISMDRFGNTSVTSIPLTLCDHYGKVNEDTAQNVLACGFGIGLSWGISSFVINAKDVFPIIETDDFYREGTVSHD